MSQEDVESGLDVWTLHYASDHYASLDAVGLPLFADWEGWRRDVGIPRGTPFLLSPELHYDVALNKFFHSTEMLPAALSTRQGYARDLRSFLDFLERGRGRRPWTEATVDDHAAYMAWRRENALGPLISDSTWNREVAAIDRFYRWQVAEGNCVASPVPQRQRRSSSRRHSEHTQPATYAHGARRGRVGWLPSRSYRRWRDIGLRGYETSGLASEKFRGRWSDRNALFADLMVRTGLRLTEQSSLLVQELPALMTLVGYHRFWLPKSIAKGASARYVYVPSAILRDLHHYIDVDRSAALARGRAAGRYDPQDRSRILIEAPAGSPAGRRKLSQLGPEDRARVLVKGDAGWEPASLWLGEGGDPLSRKTWQDLFSKADARCRAAGVGLSAHPHLLRHTYAVNTLELMYRGHLDDLARFTSTQRLHYRMIWGEPIRWVQARLGHKSQTSTEIYLHTLERLEMETRMTLVDENWDDARALVTHLDDYGSMEIGGDRP
ncbi:tyrosine-type recombinase/integrase [Microbacterium sp. zg.Y1090]|uniref:tyrosine-type recombinase/integrase n=1 Tax=Microbacterium wangruii TaxID=3049073 RepID=UPI00214DB4B9|nr:MULTISPECIES: site-specific integrase [unclassified Microbacterium]MCR2818919.1 tyrosine-type recombinase/integrase [Microbacterium sp. zg.Y1090]WIM27226.1 tyrosine-type recombinase/integrase [Microbacterium sp. zg-Y1090]